jgi:hypothetical protein
MSRNQLTIMGGCYQSAITPANVKGERNGENEKSETEKRVDELYEPQ